MIQLGLTLVNMGQNDYHRELKFIVFTACNEQAEAKIKLFNFTELK
jgi:hypothetical protein